MEAPASSGRLLTTREVAHDVPDRAYDQIADVLVDEADRLARKAGP